MKALLQLILGRRVVTIALFVVAAALLAPAATSQTPAAESHLDGGCDSGPAVDETSSTGSVHHADSRFAASASAASRRLTANTAVHADNEHDAHKYCSVLSSFENTVTVGAGSTGKAAGDPVSLAVTVRLQGHLLTGYHGPSSPPGQRSWDVTSQVWAQFDLTDPDREVCTPDEGREVCRPAELAGFWAEARQELHAGFPWEGDRDGNVSGRDMWGWELTGNRGQQFGDGEDDVRELCSAWPGSFPCQATEIPPPLESDYRGTRTVLVDTYVGARLELRGVLSILADATKDAHARASFSELNDDFSVKLAPAPGFEGLDLVYALGSPPPPPLPLPELSISDPTVTEGDSGQTAATFAVSLSAASAEPVIVSYSTLPGTASGDDYDSGGGWITFAPGELEKTVTIAVFGDQVTEGDETFLLDLMEAVGATIPDRYGEATIVDDDQPVSPYDVVASVKADLEKLIAGAPGSKLADKLEDALDKVDQALAKLDAGDRQGALGALEGVVDELRAAIGDGLPSADSGELMDRLAGAARSVADETIAEAQARSGNPAKIAEAESLREAGDAKRAAGLFKDAVAKYTDAVSKAAGA